MLIKLVQDKVVKHSVRYAIPQGASDLTMSVYVPKELILRMQMENPGVEMENGFPKMLWLKGSLKEIA